MRRWERLIRPVPGVSWEYAQVVGVGVTVGELIAALGHPEPSISKAEERAIRALYPSVRRSHVEAACAYRRWVALR